MIDASQLPRLPTKIVHGTNEPAPDTPDAASPSEQVKKMELKAGRYYAVNEEN